MFLKKYKHSSVEMIVDNVQLGEHGHGNCSTITSRSVAHSLAKTSVSATSSCSREVGTHMVDTNRPVDANRKAAPAETKEGIAPPVNPGNWNSHSAFTVQTRSKSRSGGRSATYQPFFEGWVVCLQN